MKATLITDWTIGDICKGFQYNEYEGKGLYGLSGRLTIQPEFQRHYLYAENGGKKELDVIRSVRNGYPLGLLYFSKVGEDKYEVLDGQQRITSLGRFLTEKFAWIDNDGMPWNFTALNADEQKQIKEELDILRPLLKEALLNSNYKVFKKGVLKVFFLGKTVSVSTSKKSSSTLKFDEATFKKENPELWKQYCIKTYSGGCGGNLTIKDMSEKQLKECSKIDTKVKEVLPWAK